MDLPWTDSGLVPDIVFNPHGFPSRMTIAMMIECMAGKSGACHGLVHDATPFRFGEGGARDAADGAGGDDAIQYFARHLEEAGYNYYGTETLYSGTGMFYFFFLLLTQPTLGGILAWYITWYLFLPCLRYVSCPAG